MKAHTLLLAGCAALLAAAALVQPAPEVSAQDPGQAPDFSLVPVAGDVGLVKNPSGGNVAVLRNRAGALVVDTNLPSFRDQYERAFEGLMERPARFVINTHWHGDHTGNNVLFGRDAVPVVAHRGVRARLLPEPGVEGRTAKDTPAEALPTVTYGDSLELFVGAERVRLTHYGAGHTDGDSVVWFHGSRVVHMGDLFFHGLFPFIDLGAGGDSRGYVGAMAQVVAELERLEGDGQGAWRVIPGHGAVCGLEELKAYHRGLQDCLQRVERALAAGQSTQQMIEGELLKDYEAWSWAFISTEKIIGDLATDLAK